MKTKLFFLVSFLLIANQLFAQVPFINNSNNAGTLRAERNSSYSVSGATLDRFEITNATKFDNQFIPILWGHHSSDNRSAFAIMGTTLANRDNGSSPLVTFRAAVSPGLRLNSPTNGDFPWGNEQTLQTLNTRPTFAWYNGFNTQMTLSAQNNLGIGVTSPTARLHTSGTVRFQNLPNGSNPTFMLGTDASGNVKKYSVSGGDTDWLTPSGGTPTSINNDIYTNGKVGIGVNNAQETLHINGNIRGNQNGAIRINTNSGYVDVGAKSSFFAYFDTSVPKFRFNKDIHVLGGVISSASVGGPFNNKNLKLQTVGITRIFADFGTGNVGIGTESPLETLHVNGTVRGSQTSGALRIKTAQGYVDIGPKGASASNFDTDRSKFNFNRQIYITGGTVSSAPSFFVGDSDLKLQTEGTTRIIATQEMGYVGVNTLTPTANFHNKGTVRFENLPSKTTDQLIGIDDNGDLYRIRNSGGETTRKIESLVQKLNTQEKEINELKIMLNLLLHDSKNVQTSIQESRIISTTPNPASGKAEVAIRIDETVYNANLVLTDMLGTVLKSIPLRKSNGLAKYDLQQDNLSSGTYIISLVLDGNIIDSKKLIFK